MRSLVSTLMARLQHAVIVLAAFGLGLPLSSIAACRVSSMQMPVRMIGTRAVATVGINGADVPLTVDTGAFYSFLTEAAAAQLKLSTRSAPGIRISGLTGSTPTHLATVDKLMLLKGEVPHVEFIVGGTEPGAGTMGLLGRNLLFSTDTEYDLANGVIRFLVPGDDCEKTTMAYWAGAMPVTEADLVQRGGLKMQPLRVRVKLNGEELLAVLDSGATTLVSLRAAKRAGIVDADLTPAGKMYGVSSRLIQQWSAPFETFELGGEKISHNRLAVADISLPDADMLLGIDFFLSHRIYVSQSQSKLFFTFNGGVVFAQNQHDATTAVPSPSSAAASGTDASRNADEFARRAAGSAARRDYRAALVDLDQAVAMEPTSSVYLAQRGAVLEALGLPARARADFDEALERDPSQVDARLRRAALRLRDADRDGALADLDVLDRTLPQEAHVRLTLATLYLKLDQPAKALVQLNLWLPVHPDEVGRPETLNRRCTLRLHLGVELDAALDDCDNAVDADDKNAVFVRNRGWVHLRLGHDKKALRDFERSLVLRPQAAWALYGRALAKARLGDPEQGNADLAAARKVEPGVDRAIAKSGFAPALVSGAASAPGS